MDATLIFGRENGQTRNVSPHVDTIFCLGAEGSSRYVRAGGTVFTEGAGGVRTCEEAIFVHSTELSTLGELQAVIMAYENGY